MRNRRLSIALALLLTSHGARADDAPGTAGVAFFEQRIRPVLVSHCYECHSAEAGAAEGELRLDTREAIRAGGSRGSAVVPREPEKSILLTAVSHSDPNLQMPPKEPRLPDSVIADFKKWIELGAPDPRDAGSAGGKWGAVDGGGDFWSYQTPTSPVVPTIAGSDWPRQDIDHFVLRKLRENGLSPSSDAAPEVLLRRMHFDLVGLPPSPEQLSRFAAACEETGIETAIASAADSLLDSPQFGERWGRHWLDVARYGESSGKDSNISFPYAWRYRDYVIDCFNDGVAFDRFLVEQLAGDLLPYETDEERARLLIATGFLAAGPKNLGEGDPVQFNADLIDEQIDALSRGVMGNSIACARCHDHKFDPFSMEDYYALAGIFASTNTCFGTSVSPANRMGGDPLPLPRTQHEVILHKGIGPEQVEQLKSELTQLRAERAEMDKATRMAFAGMEPEKSFTLRDALRNVWRTGAVEGQLEKVGDDGSPLPLAMGVLDREEIVDAPLLERGDVKRPAGEVPRGFPQVFDVGNEWTIPGDQSGRLQLARWITHPDHPLTSRVIVNRVWHHLYGAGLVRTVDNFGTTGEPPSHPELLDFLAVRLVDEGWSIKQLIRELVLSRTYRQSSAYRAEAFEQDPENRLLWRMPKRRLEAEAIRDAMLAVSGEIDLERPVGSLVARVIGDGPVSLVGLNKLVPADLDGSVHRSVYLPVLRDRLPDALDLFDFAEPSLVTGDRDVTNVPVQALYLMNSPFVQGRAAGLASRLARETQTVAELVQRGFLLCYSRPPDSQEQARALEFLRQNNASAEASGEPQAPSEEHRLSGNDTVLFSFCQGLLSTAEFRNID